MAEAAISLNGRIYRIGCGAGEERRLEELSQIVRSKLEGLVAEHGQIGDERLLLLSALLIADEMLETRARIVALEAELDTGRRSAKAAG